MEVWLVLVSVVFLFVDSTGEMKEFRRMANVLVEVSLLAEGQWDLAVVW